MNKHVQLLSLLAQLTTQLQQHQLWSEQGVTQAQLNSQVPFAADTMSFENWLQFVFIVKMSQLAKEQAPLPTNIAIAPMAQMSFTNEQQALIATLQQIDQLCSGDDHA